MMEKGTVRINIPTTLLLQVMLIVLKFSGIIDWDWLVVLAPLVFGLVFYSLVAIGLIIIAGLE